MKQFQMKRFQEMTNDQLTQLLECCFRSQAALTVKSKVPAAFRIEYRQYQQSITAIEQEQYARISPSQDW